MTSILLWSRRLLLASLGFVSLIALVGAGVSGHWLGSLAWGFSLLLILVLSAVLFGERFVANPVKVAAAVVNAVPASLAWLPDLFDAIARKELPLAEAEALAKATLANDLKSAKEEPAAPEVPA